MKIVFISNFLNHHQIPFCDSISALSEVVFHFLPLERMNGERISLGWALDDTKSYEIPVEEISKVSDCLEHADLILFGAAPLSYIKHSLDSGKTVLKISERVFKDKYELWKLPFRIFTYWYNYGKYKNLYLLTASAYTAFDYSRHHCLTNKMYKWGYFPQTKRYAINDLLEKKNKKCILWCGRFLDWKHPDDVVTIAKHLKAEKYAFKIQVVGQGEMEEELRQMVIYYNLSDCVEFLGSMPPERVREYMENAGIYLFTSDRHEGWGAVLNESMNSGCAVVASHAIGSVPYLMVNGKNGLVYQSGDVESLYHKVKYLLDNPDEQNRLGRNAYETITTLWNAEIAAERLINLSEHILIGDKFPDLYETGPCSKAEIIKDDWFKDIDYTV